MSNFLLSLFNSGIFFILDNFFVQLNALLISNCLSKLFYYIKKQAFSCLKLNILTDWVFMDQLHIAPVIVLGHSNLILKSCDDSKLFIYHPFNQSLLAWPLVIFKGAFLKSKMNGTRPQGNHSKTYVDAYFRLG